MSDDDETIVPLGIMLWDHGVQIADRHGQTSAIYTDNGAACLFNGVIVTDPHFLEGFADQLQEFARRMRESGR